MAALRAEIERLRTENAELRAENTELRERVREQARPTDAAPPKPEQPKPQQYDREEMAARMRATRDAHEREIAMYGGRPRDNVLDAIKRLLTNRRLTNRVIEVIAEVMLPYVATQDNIERGISRRTYRKVLADLHPDRSKGNSELFDAFKGLDVPKDGKRKWPCIVIPDEKVTTMADYWRKREERSAKAKAKRAARA